MTTIINAVASTGLTQTADGSGIIKVQSNGVTTNALAWVRFAGSSGTIAASYNISSVTRNAAGYYTVNFATTTTDSNYVYCVGASTDGGNFMAAPQLNTTNSGKTQINPTTSAFSFVMLDYAFAGYRDPNQVYAIVFGN